LGRDTPCLIGIFVCILLQDLSHNPFKAIKYPLLQLAFKRRSISLHFYFFQQLLIYNIPVVVLTRKSKLVIWKIRTIVFNCGTINEYKKEPPEYFYLSGVLRASRLFEEIFLRLDRNLRFHLHATNIICYIKIARVTHSTLNNIYHLFLRKISSKRRLARNTPDK
jgi:hypothetical protein